MQYNTLLKSALKITKGDKFIAEEIVQIAYVKAIKNKADNIHAYAKSALLHTFLDFKRDKEMLISRDVVSYDNDEDPGLTYYVDEYRERSWLLDLNNSVQAEGDSVVYVKEILAKAEELPDRQWNALADRINNGVGHSNLKGNRNTIKANFRHAVIKLELI